MRWLLVLVAGALAVPAGAAPTAPPRNGLIAYVSRDAHGYGIAVVRENGRSVRMLTRNARDAAPSWSPDGTRLLFSRGRFLYTLRLDGRPARRLTRGDATRAWSPDGKRIAFTRAGLLFVIGTDGAGPRQLTRTGRSSQPAWSPDGRLIAFVRNGALLVLRPDGSAPRTIFRGGTAYAGSANAPVWSPDGTRIAFGACCELEPPLMVILGRDGRRASIIGSGHDFDGIASEDYGPRWSPDGTRLAFTRTVWYCGRCDQNGVWTVRADDTNEVEVTNDGEWPEWSPDGRKLVAETSDGLKVFTADGRQTTRLGVVGYAASWQPLRR